MRRERFTWEGARGTALAIREWAGEEIEEAEVLPIMNEVREGGDKALLSVAARFDGAEPPLRSLRVDANDAYRALSELDADMRKAIELAAANVRTVAEAQVDTRSQVVELPQGQKVGIRETPVGAAGIYAPGGHAAYPSTVLMCAIPARAAGVKRIALASPPGSDGAVNPLVLAAAAFCGIEEIYAMGGAHAIAALGYGTETIEEVDVIAGPGNVWVQQAKRLMYGFVGIDSFAGPSELMVVVDSQTEPAWAALDLCAQAEHAPGGALAIVAIDDSALDAVVAATEKAAEERSLAHMPVALVRVPSARAAIELANAFAPEHLELLVEDAGRLAEGVQTAGCVFTGNYGATAFGDYVAGSNHVLPTVRGGRFAGPLGPGTFRRKISTVEVPPEAAAKLAPLVDTIARAEGFPVHGESAMIRTEK